MKILLFLLQHSTNLEKNTEFVIPKNKFQIKKNTKRDLDLIPPKNNKKVLPLVVQKVEEKNFQNQNEKKNFTHASTQG